MKLALLSLALLPLAAVHIGQAPASSSHLAQSIGARAQSGALSVAVSDPIAHRPVKHAAVKIIPLAPIRPMWSGFTDDQGVFDAGLLPPGSYMVDVRSFIDHARAQLELFPDTRNVVHLEIFSEIDR
jgi:hypothetical protein